MEDLAEDLSEADAKVDVGALPHVRGYAAELQALFQNLITNAVEAIQDMGEVVISTHSMQIDAVKIDRSFISGGKGNERLAVARTIVQLARSLEADVIAEGVETHDQFRFLRTVGCGSAQGYLFSAPVRGAKIVELIRDGYPLDNSAAR